MEKGDLAFIKRIEKWAAEAPGDTRMTVGAWMSMSGSRCPVGHAFLNDEPPSLGFGAMKLSDPILAAIISDTLGLIISSSTVGVFARGYDRAMEGLGQDDPSRWYTLDEARPAIQAGLQAVGQCIDARSTGPVESLN